jgi:hypothetical protein
MEKPHMIKSFEILRPANIPYRLLSFQFFFENVNSPVVNFYHAAGMHLNYLQIRIAYAIQKNEFYQLLHLQNRDDPHEPKYDWLLMKGIFDEHQSIPVRVEIEDEKNDQQLPSVATEWLLHRLPHAGDELMVGTNGNTLYHHFVCNELSNEMPGLPLMRLIYLNSYTRFHDILNSWFNEENKLLPLP